VLDRRSEPGCDEHGACLIVLQADGVAFVVQGGAGAGARRGTQPFLFGVALETRHRAQPPSDPCTSWASLYGVVAGSQGPTKVASVSWFARFEYSHLPSH
jgi:hypothetical protein